MFTPATSDGRRRACAARAHVLGLAFWAVAVLAAHGVLLAGWPVVVPRVQSEPLRALTVRQLAAAPAPEPGHEPEHEPGFEAEAEPAAVAEAAQEVAPEPGEARPARLAAVVDATLPAAAQAGVAAATMAAGAAAAPPTYRTRMPPSAVLRYDLRRGALGGEGELRWQRDGDRYEMQLQGTVFGLTLLWQTSRGGFDAAGIAPERFLDRRRGREQRAASFQRERGLITYSGDEARHPLLPGAQDRLSWMAQLAAIVEADPPRWRPGAQVEMAVSGSRGDSDVWTFTVTGLETIALVGGRTLEALALKREPRKPFDTAVEVWLDPGRHHLPVRMRLSNGRDGEALQFVLIP